MDKARELLSLLTNAIEDVKAIAIQGPKSSVFQHMFAVFRDARAYLAQPEPPREPPREPTREMLRPAMTAYARGCADDLPMPVIIAQMWRAMHDAAPAAEPVAQQPGGERRDRIAWTAAHTAAQQPEAPDGLVARLRAQRDLFLKTPRVMSAAGLLNEAIARIESDAERIRKSESLRIRLADDLDRAHSELAASRERGRALQNALRRHVISGALGDRGGHCRECWGFGGSEWGRSEPERHADGCLAAPERVKEQAMSDHVLDTARELLAAHQLDGVILSDRVELICRALIARTEALRELLRAREAWHATQRDESVGNDVKDQVLWDERMDVAERDYDAALEAARRALDGEHEEKR